jgi:HK97 family phage major capsid protein
MNAKWIRALVRKDKVEMQTISKEIKQRFQTEMEPILHLGPATDEISLDLTQGGYLIPSLLLAEVNRFVISGGVARREFRYLPFAGAGNSRYIPTLLTNVTVSWVDEGEEKPKTKPTFSRVEQTLNKLAAIVILTEEIIEDAIIDLVSLCGQLLGEAIAAEEDNQFFSGTGAPWTGIINDPNVVAAALAAGVGPVDMRPEALLAMTVAIPEGAVAGAKFYMNRQIWAAICARRADAVVADDVRGNYLIQQPSQGSPGSIWGFPVVLVEAMPSLTDLGYGTDPDPDLPFIIFGNLQKCVVYGDKQGIRVKILDQASVYDDNDNLINLAERDMIALRVHKRVGYVIVLPTGICVLSTGAVS